MFSTTEPKDQGLLEAAYEQAQLAVQHEPSDPETLFLLGMIAVDVGDYDAAKDAYNRIVALDPTSAWAEQARQQLALLESLGLGRSGSPSAEARPDSGGA